MRRFATAFLTLILLPGLLEAQDASWVTLGSPAEDRLRVDQILGRDSTAGFLLRTPSVLTPFGSPAHLSYAIPSHPGDTLEVRLLPPEALTVWSSEIPYSRNDGMLWAGRGVSTLIRAGLAARFGPATLVFAPELTYSANEPFGILPGRHPNRNFWSSPWHVRERSADLPLRFGDESVILFGPGQSSLTLRTGPVAFGVSSENMWWGPGIRNGIVMSSHAQGIPHAFVRTNGPVPTGIGDFEARLVIGGLTESLYFDTIPENDVRALSGLVLTYRPTYEPNLTVGIARTVVAPTGGSGAVLGHLFNVFTKWERHPDSPGVDEDPGTDQLLSFFGRWVFPESGLELFGEWSRLELPDSFGHLFETPHHTQGYTVGLQWARPVADGESLVRLQGEVTYLEQTRALRDRPSPWSYYTGRAASHGYTQRGQVIGASVGPGASSQWLALDYMAPAWRLGVFASRVRWENDIFYRRSAPAYWRHDVSFRMGVRGGLRLPWAEVAAEVTGAKRFNYLFQNNFIAPGVSRLVDIRNYSVSLYLTPRP